MCARACQLTVFSHAENTNQWRSQAFLTCGSLSEVRVFFIIYFWTKVVSLLLTFISVDVYLQIAHSKNYKAGRNGTTHCGQHVIVQGH